MCVGHFEVNADWGCLVLVEINSIQFTFHTIALHNHLLNKIYFVHVLYLLQTPAFFLFTVA